MDLASSPNEVYARTNKAEQAAAMAHERMELAAHGIYEALKAYKLAGQHMEACRTQLSTAYGMLEHGASTDDFAALKTPLFPFFVPGGASFGCSSCCWLLITGPLSRWWHDGISCFCARFRIEIAATRRLCDLCTGCARSGIFYGFFSFLVSIPARAV